MGFLDFTSEFGVYALGGVFWLIILGIAVFVVYGIFKGIIAFRKW